ncbi:MAG: DUF29 family protein [Bauldia sp.]|nr:DUF29 family protein [Bauldia sp.]
MDRHERRENPPPAARLRRRLPRLDPRPGGEALARQYAIARLHASGETGLPLDDFPESCPFAIEQVLDPAFWPDVLKP